MTDNSQATAVLARSAQHMRKMADGYAALEGENQALKDKVASYEKVDRARGIALQMQEKGLNASLTFEEKVASLAGHPDLDRVEEAVKMASSGDLNLVSVTSDDDGVHGHQADSANAFAAFCVTGSSE